MELSTNNKNTLLLFFKQIKEDKHVVVFFLNCFLVVLGYYIANIIPAVYPVIKVLKTVLLFYSVVDQIVYHYNNNIQSYGIKMGIIYIYLGVMLLTIPFSFDGAESFSRYITYLGGVIYVALFSKYIVASFPIIKAVKVFTFICFAVYVLPVIVAIIKLPVLSSVQFQIYGDKELAKSLGFMSNNFGWAGSIIFLSIFGILSFFKIENKIKIVLIALMLFSVFLILVSQSRSSLLIMAVSIILMISGSRIQFSYKFLIIFAITLVFIVNNQFELVDLGTSRFNDKLVGDRANFAKELRVIVLENTRTFFYFNQDFYLHGFGWGVFVPAYQQYINAGNDMDLHNSYLQLFYECGIFPFTIFFGLFFIPAIIKFFFFFRRHLIFFPFLILPYFENNLNSGQFVFFPFMFTLFFISSYQHKI